MMIETKWDIKVRSDLNPAKVKMHIEKTKTLSMIEGIAASMSEEELTAWCLNIGVCDKAKMLDADFPFFDLPRNSRDTSKMSQEEFDGFCRTPASSGLTDKEIHKHFDNYLIAIRRQQRGECSE